MNAFMNNSIQPLSSYNPININGLNNSSSVSTTNIKTNTVGVAQASANITDSVNAAIVDSEKSMLFNASLLNSKLDAKVQYDNDMSSSTEDKPLKDFSQSTTSAGAIQQYLLHQHSAQREQIQQMVGIDLYA